MVLDANQANFSPISKTIFTDLNDDVSATVEKIKGANQYFSITQIVEMESLFKNTIFKLKGEERKEDSSIPNTDRAHDSLETNQTRTSDPIDGLQNLFVSLKIKK